MLERGGLDRILTRTNHDVLEPWPLESVRSGHRHGLEIKRSVVDYLFQHEETP